MELYPLTRIARGDPTSPRKRGEVITSSHIRQLTKEPLALNSVQNSVFGTEALYNRYVCILPDQFRFTLNAKYQVIPELSC
jgi:hypothetical protein